MMLWGCLGVYACMHNNKDTVKDGIFTILMQLFPKAIPLSANVIVE